MSKDVIVRSNQDIYDICLQEYGTLELLGKLIDENNLNFDGEISQGQILQIDELENGNADVKDFYELRKKHPQNFYIFKNDIPPFSFDNDIITWDTILHSFDSTQL